jgi:hypothetical protein
MLSLSELVVHSRTSSSRLMAIVNNTFRSPDWRSDGGVEVVIGTTVAQLWRRDGCQLLNVISPRSGLVYPDPRKPSQLQVNLLCNQLRLSIALQVPNIGGQIAIEYSGSTLRVSTSGIVLSDTKSD